MYSYADSESVSRWPCIWMTRPSPRPVVTPSAAKTGSMAVASCRAMSVDMVLVTLFSVKGLLLLVLILPR
jgi:hypothetical protein